MKLKDNLKKLLKDNNLNVLKLSKISGVPKSTLSDWLAGNSPKNIKQVKLVAEYFNVSVDQLVFSEKPTSHSYNEIQDLVHFGKYDVFLKKI